VLPGASDRALAPLVLLEAGRAPDWLRRLAVLGGADVPARLRLSRAEAAALDALRAGLGSAAGPAEIGYRHGTDRGADILLARAALAGQPLPEAWQADLARGAAAVLPVGAADLMPALTGAALGRRLAGIEARWIASDFKLDRAALLAPT
jgi:poly(A) polymerase